ncbi:unnamed protein product [Effrenium voratum]|nr:unnamed protein product [Effrenium voratum]
MAFAWVSPLMERGNRPPPIDIAHMLPPPEDMRAEALARELSSELLRSSWRRRSHGRKDGDPVDQAQLTRGLLRLNRGRLLKTGFLRFLNTSVQFLPALCLGPLLDAVQKADFAAGQAAAVRLFAVLCIKTFVENQFFHQTTVMATRVRAMLQASIYEKSLRLQDTGFSVPPVTLMQVDTGKVEDLTYAFHTLWDGIFQVAGYSVLLWWYLGLAGFAGIVVLIVCLPFNAQLQRNLSRLNKKCLQASDARVSQTSEILGGIRALRQMGWEDVFERRVRSLRDAELEAQRSRDTVAAYLLSYFSALPPFMIAVVLMAYVGAAHSSFNAAMIFTALSLLNQIRFPLLFYPNALNALAEGQAALGRLSAFLALPEAAAHRPPMSEDKELPLLLKPGSYPLGTSSSSPSLVLPEPISVKEGELVAVIGPVGSGKSSLLRAFLGEMPGTDLLAPPQDVAYCSQQPWVPEGRSLLEVVCGVWEDGGVAFPAKVDEAAFSTALAAAAVDFAEAEDEVSGTSLSGGQQARLALARAMYKAQRRGEVCACVLDDVTAALDPRVTLEVMNNCLNGPLKGLATVFVSSDGPWLQRCDRIIAMRAEGKELRVDSVGSYEELAAGGRLVPGPVPKPKEQPEETEAAATQEVPKRKKLQVTSEEERALGAVPLKLYSHYFASARSPRLLSLAGVAVMASYAATVAQQWFIGLWTADASMSRGLVYYMSGVLFWGLLASALTFGRALLIAAFSRRASRAVHDQLCDQVLVRASTSHFDRNPSSRLLQNFSKDLEQIDSSLPGSLRSAVSSICTLAGAMVTIVLATPGLGNLIVLASSLVCLLSAGAPGAAAGGAWAEARSAIAVTQALSVCGLLNWTVRTIAQTETSFTSFQRITGSLESTELEAPRELPQDAQLPAAWPVQGTVTFEGVSFRYRPMLPLVLQKLELQLAPGQRIGVIGRTGSGKSTLLRILLRTVEPCEGSVKIDGVDLQQVGLARLRSAITAIPQDNFLVSGTIRENVDPRSSYSDEEVRHALEAASLGTWDLQRRVDPSGGISPGEKQLIGVARAVLRRSRVVALDEVTSRVDKATDEKVQQALKRLPEGTTLLVVSHRLATLHDYDQVVVLGDGQVLEIGNPAELEASPNSHFASMLAAERGGEVF